MTRTLVLTVIADDRPGLVDTLSACVENHGGNWLDSRLAHLADKFAGVAVIEVPDANRDALEAALRALGDAEAMRLSLEETASAASLPGDLHTIEILGPDHPGIVHEITHALAKAGASVEDLKTDIQEAPHGGGTLFHARIGFRPADEETLEAVRDRLEDLAGTLMVDLEMD